MAAPQMKEKGAQSPEKVLSIVSHDLGEDPGLELMSQGSHGKKVEEGEGPWLVSYADMMTLLMGFFALIASFSKPDIQAFEKVQESATQQFGGEFKKPYEELVEKIEKILQENQLQNQVKVSRAADGVTIKVDGTLFFSSGEFVVRAEGKAVIDKILTALKSEIPQHKVLIEGHTDNVPIAHSIIASNWELSGIRAARIAQIFEGYGFTKNQLTIMGWGETKPEVPNLDVNGVGIPENQAKNRRVLLKIYKD